MKQNLAVLIVTILMIINITGCSVVRFAETRSGYGLKNVNKTEMNLDFQLGFNPADQSLRVTLEYQPYSIYKPRITLTDLGVGLAALGLLGKVLYDNWDHDYTFTFLDDTFDWYGSEPWEKAVMIGVPVDILLYWTFAYPFDRKGEKSQREPLQDYPYRIELPDHGNIGRDYRTITGTERLEIRKFLADLGNPSYLKNIESLKFQASTEINGKHYRRSHTISGIIPPDPIPDRIEIDAQWNKDRLHADEKAILKVTVKNIDETVLMGFTMITTSPEPHFDNWKLTFGDIAQGASETRGLGFRIAPETPTKDVDVSLRFQTANGFVHPEILLKLQSTE